MINRFHISLLLCVVVCLGFTGFLHVDENASGDVDGTIIRIDTDIANAGYQGQQDFSGLRENEKVGFAIYIENCSGFDSAEIVFRWDGSLASIHKNLTGLSIPDETIDINRIQDLPLAGESNIASRPGNDPALVVGHDSSGSYIMTFAASENNLPVQDGLLAFAVFSVSEALDSEGPLVIEVSVELMRDNAVSFVSEPLSFTAAPDRLFLLTPDGGEIFTAGETIAITWDSAAFDTVSLDYSTDNGDTWQDITGVAPADTGVYNWNNPDEDSQHCRIRLRDSDGNLPPSVSAGTFTIRKSPSVDIKVLDSGETATIPLYYRITDPEKRTISLAAQYSIDDGMSWEHAVLSGHVTSLDKSAYSGVIRWKARGILTGFSGDVILKVTPRAGFDGSPGTAIMTVDYIPKPSLSIDVPNGPFSGNIPFGYDMTDMERNTVDLLMEFSRDGGASWSPATVHGKTNGLTPEEYTGTVTWISSADLPDRRYLGITVRFSVVDAGMDAAYSLGPFNVNNEIRPGKASIYKYRPGDVPVLAMHNVDVNTYDNAGLSMTPEMFERIVDELSSDGFYFLSTDEFIDHIIDGAPIPERSILLTFDDGYKGHYTYMYPILKKYDAHVSVSLIGSRVNSKGYLTEDQIREMHDSDHVDFQSHSWRLHDYVNGKPKIFKLRYERDIIYRMRIISDLWLSSDRIEEMTGEPADIFVVPYGNGNELIEGFIKDAGLKAAYYVGKDIPTRYGDNPFHLERIAIYRHNTKIISKLLNMHHYKDKRAAAKTTMRTQYGTDNSPLDVCLAVKIPGGIIASSPAIGDDGTLYIGSWDNSLYAISPDGSVLWSFPTGGGISSSPAVAPDGTIYVGSYDRHIYAVTPDGTEKWRYDGWDPMYSSPAVGPDGSLYIGSTDGGIISIGPDGSSRWNYRAGDSSFSSPSISMDGAIYIGSWKNQLYAFNPDGSVQWRYFTGAGVESSPAIGPDGTLYFGCMNDFLYAVNPDGSLKWKYQTGHWIDSSPAVGVDGTIYAGSRDGFMYAFDPDGSLKWRFGTAARIEGSPAVGADGTIYFGSWDGRLYALDPDGVEKWHFATGGGIDTSPNISPDGILYFASSDSWLYGIDTKTGAGLAESSWPRFRGTTTGSGYPADSGKIRKSSESEETISGDFPAAFKLDEPHPNPFNPSTEISFSLPSESHVRLVIYNVSGQKIDVLKDGFLRQGKHSLIWNAQDFPSGLYFIRINAGAINATRKLLLLR